MLSKEQTGVIAEMIGIKADVLAQAISDEQEQTIELPKGEFLTDEKLNDVLDKHGKKRYDAGISKKAKENFEGKSKDDYDAELKASILEEAKLEPNEKLAEKDKQLEELRTSLKQKENEVLDFQGKIKVASRNTKGLDSIGVIREDLGLSRVEALNFINSALEFKEDGIYKSGELLTDQYKSALPYEQVIKQEVTDRGWNVKQIKGNGGTKPNAEGAKPKSYSEFQKYAESKGWNESSLEAKEYLRSIQGDDGFDMDN